MADDAADEAPPAMRGRRRVGCWALVAIVAIVVAALSALWFNRQQIAANVIGSELSKRGIHATYKIEQIGTRTQILRDIVVGDPTHPDLTIERAIVRIDLRLGLPAVGRITLIRPRLHGTYFKGTLSFGQLDPLLFQKKEKTPFELPDLDLAIEDGRALLESDYGQLGIKVTGQGNLRDDFTGELAAISPQLALGGCASGRTTLYGQLAIYGRKPTLTGPLRFDRLRCPTSKIALRSGALQLRVATDENLQKFDGNAVIKLGPAAFAQGLLASVQGQTRFTWSNGDLIGKFDLQGRGLASSELALSRLRVAGTIRALRMFDRVELETDASGEGVQVGSGLDAALASAASGTRGTLLSPLIGQARRQLAREGRGSTLAAQLTVRRTGGRTAVVIPGAALRAGSGATLLSLARFQLTAGPGRAPQFSGSFATGGEGLPRIVGTMALHGAGGVHARLAMAEYAAGGSRITIPELAVTQQADGVFGFAGTVRASGPLPSGRIDNLLLPISGNWVGGRLSLWPGCVPVRFDRLQYAGLTLERQSLTLCPPSGAPILRYGAAGLRLAVGTPSLRLAGRLGQTRIAIRSGPVGFAYPGTLSARQLDVALGPPATAQRFLVADLTAKLGSEVTGRFAGADVRLFSVPLDVLGASGNWRYAGGTLALSDGSFQLADRQANARFAPLIGGGASLTLADNVITAAAILREPRGNREVSRLDVRHDLTSGRGRAELAVAGVTFGPGFQPTDLTERAKGVVANVRGTITGMGRITWGPQGVTSTGRFASKSLDFAAAFGPVSGAAGSVAFTDLLGLTTAPGQRIHVASVNPGIEVTDGDVELQLRGGQVLAVQGATWPFMGGTLTLRPVTVTFGVPEERHYVLEVRGLDAPSFIQRMDLENISATGVFDGTIPLVFDVQGNGRIDGGELLSRAPGGNVAYVGALSYKDLGAMANYAFDALKSLDYRQMSVQMNGNLAGEILANVRFDGVKQGAGAKQNLITRQIAKLPIRFDINVRAAFRDLLSSVRSLYDPAMVRDPRELGLIDAQGRAIGRGAPAASPAPTLPIQRRESEDKR